MSKFTKPNIQQLRERYSKINENKSGFNWFPLDDLGTFIIRLLPPTEGLYDPLMVTYSHKVGKSSIVCPKRTHNKQCAVCDYITEIYNSGTDDEKTAIAILRPKFTAFGQFVIKGFKKNEEVIQDIESALYPESEWKPYLYGVKWAMYNDILSYFANPMYGDITDVEQGRDIFYTIKINKTNGYRAHNIQMFPILSPLATAQSTMDNIEKGCIDLKILAPVVSYEDTERYLTNYLSGGSTQGYDEGEPKEEAPKPAQASTSVPEVAEERIPKASQELVEEVATEQPKAVQQPAQTNVKPATIEIKGDTDDLLNESTLPCYGKNYSADDASCGICVDKDECAKLTKGI